MSNSSESNSHKIIWDNTLAELELQFNRATFYTHLKGASFVRATDTEITVEVANDFSREFLTGRMKESINDTLRAVSGNECLSVRFIVNAFPKGSYPAVNGKGGTPSPVEEWPSEPSLSSQQPSTEMRHKSLRPGEAMISLHQDDPQRRGYVSVPHYTLRFWRPFLGGIPFDVWQILRSYGYHAGYSGTWPTIRLLSDIMAHGTRHTLLGRNEAGSGDNKRKAQRGAIEVLADHRLLSYTTKGIGRQRVYFFTVVDTAPILTPYQLRTLPVTVQVEHKRFLSRIAGFNYETWQEVEEETLLKPLVSRT